MHSLQCITFTQTSPATMGIKASPCEVLEDGADAAESPPKMDAASLPTEDIAISACHAQRHLGRLAARQANRHGTRKLLDPRLQSIKDV